MSRKRKLIEELTALGPTIEETEDSFLELARAVIANSGTARAAFNVGKTLMGVSKISDAVARAGLMFDLAIPRPDNFNKDIGTMTTFNASCTRSRFLWKSGILVAMLLSHGSNFRKRYFKNRRHYAAGFVPKVAFEEAIESLGNMDVILASGLDELNFAYTDDQAEFVGNRYLELVQNKIREQASKFIAGGQTLDDGAALLAAVTPWTTAQSRTALRTATTTAFSAGRFKQVEKLEEFGFQTAFVFETAGDVDVRRNHQAVNGLTARSDDPVWNQFSPPLGFNCRCILRPIFANEVPIKLKTGDGIRLLRRSEYPNAKPDSPNFGRKASTIFYGS